MAGLAEIYYLTVLETKGKNQGVCRVMLSWKVLGKDLFQVCLLDSSLVCDLVFTWHSPCVLVDVFVSFYKKVIRHIGLGTLLISV